MLLKVWIFVPFQAKKPLMEKMRRARINDSLNELKSLVLDLLQKDVSINYFTTWTFILARKLNKTSRLQPFITVFVNHELRYFNSSSRHFESFWKLISLYVNFFCLVETWTTLAKGFVPFYLGFSLFQDGESRCPRNDCNIPSSNATKGLSHRR